MPIDQDLLALAREMASIETHFVQSSTLGLHLRTRDQAEFKRLVVEAKSILDSELGALNNFSMNLVQSANLGVGGFLGGTTLSGVQDCRALIEGAVNHIRRRPAPPQMPSPENPVLYVHASRLGALRSLTGKQWDVARLVQLCDELNIAYANNCTMATAMLVRSIVDHVPPVLGCKTFNDVESSYAGAKSFRASMKHLNHSLRNIADAHLHVQIRAKEVVPNALQVDFRADLDVLLAEVIRVLR